MNEYPPSHDWNAVEPPLERSRTITLQDETLRDGLQSPSAVDPRLPQKLSILRLLDEVGVESVSLGLPGSGSRARRDLYAMVRCICDERLSIRPTVAARTHPADIAPAIDLVQRVGTPIEAMVFLGCSPIRMLTERWDEPMLERRTRQAVRQCLRGGLDVAFVTEDTTRSHPDTLRRLFSAALEEGATALVLCDTVGHATPEGTRNLVTWTHRFLVAQGVRDDIRVDWHGHNDRGLGLANALEAANAGVDQLHGTVGGIGERVGNTCLARLLRHLDRPGSRDLGRLPALISEVQAACDALERDQKDQSITSTTRPSSSNRTIMRSKRLCQ